MKVRNGSETEKSKSFEIKPLTQRFIRQVKEIEVKNNLAAWTFDDYQAEILRENSVCLIAKFDEQVLGFIIARLIMQDFTVVSEKENVCKLLNEAEIYNFAVAEEARRNGIGKALLKEFINKAFESEISEIWLEVRRSNKNAIGFYRKHGFAEIQVRKNFYRSPTEDGILMKLVLKKTDN